MWSVSLSLSLQWSHQKTCRNTGISGCVQCQITSAHASSLCEYLSVCRMSLSAVHTSDDLCVSGMKTVRWETQTSTRRSPRYRRRSCVWSAHRFTPAEGIICRHDQQPESGGEHREEHLSLSLSFASSLTSPLVHPCFFTPGVRAGHDFPPVCDSQMDMRWKMQEWTLMSSSHSGGQWQCNKTRPLTFLWPDFLQSRCQSKPGKHPTGGGGQLMKSLVFF